MKGRKIFQFCQPCIKERALFTHDLNANSLGDGASFPHITHIGYINKYRSRQHLVLLMALDLYCPNDVVDYLAEQLESFFFFANTMGIQTKTYEQRFSAWAVKLRGVKTKDAVDAAVQDTLVPFVLKRLPDFRQALSQIPNSDNKCDSHGLA